MVGFDPIGPICIYDLAVERTQNHIQIIHLWTARDSGHFGVRVSRFALKFLSTLIISLQPLGSIDLKLNLHVIYCS